MIKSENQELSIIQKTYDLIKWYVPLLNKLPKTHKFTLGDRIINRMYDLLEALLKAKYSRRKLEQLQDINLQLDIIRYQTRIVYEFEAISVKQYGYVSELIEGIGIELGNWIKSQKGKE